MIVFYYKATTRLFSNSEKIIVTGIQVMKANRQVFLHAVRLEEMPDPLRSAFIERVSDERKVRISRFLRQADADRSLLSELLILHGAKQLFGLSGHLELATNQYGKPYFPTCPDVHFNVTHAHEWVLCAWDLAPVGVDIEPFRTVDCSIAERFFTEAECRLLDDTVDEYAKQRLFFQLWTLKECYVKKLGRGLSIPLNAFDVEPDGREARLTVLDPAAAHDSPSYFKAYELRTPTSTYIASICASHDRFPEAPDILRISDFSTN